MSKEPKEVPFNPSQWYEWVLPRKQGDITVFAPNREWAAREIREQGYECDEKKLVMHDRMLTDILHRQGIS